VLEAVQNQQRRVCPEHAGERRHRIGPVGLAAESAHNRREDERGIGEGVERHEDRALR
jgi:hypothetical protein